MRPGSNCPYLDTWGAWDGRAPERSPGANGLPERAWAGPCVRMFVHQVYDVTVKDICRRVPYISPTNSTGIRLRFLILFVQSYQQILIQTGKSLRRKLKVEKVFIHTRRRPFCHLCLFYIILLYKFIVSELYLQSLQ
jgi:hypothetical protein